MKKHTIVVGYGRNGKQAIHELELYHEPVVIIDSNAIEQGTNTEHKKWVIGDATTDETLLEAGIMEAKAIINALPSDADNLYTSISAKSLNPNIMIISRASSESAERKLRAVGVSHVITPEKVGGIYMAGYVAQADLTEFMNHLRVDHSNPGILTELDCNQINQKHHQTNVETLLSGEHSLARRLTLFSSVFFIFILTEPIHDFVVAKKSQLAVIFLSLLFTISFYSGPLLKVNVSDRDWAKAEAIWKDISKLDSYPCVDDDLEVILALEAVSAKRFQETINNNNCASRTIK